MDEKEFEAFERAWLFLGRKVCEKYGVKTEWMKVVFADETNEEEAKDT